MKATVRCTQWFVVVVALSAAAPIASMAPTPGGRGAAGGGQAAASDLKWIEDLQWLTVDDQRLDWLNVGAWEPRGDGVQPVRVATGWRDQFPAPTKRRALAAAGITVRFRTDSRRIVVRATLIDTPDVTVNNPPLEWERGRPSYFDLYLDGKFVQSVAGGIQPDRQDVVIYDAPDAPVKESEVTLLFPFYYRNAEIIMNAIGIEKTAKLARAAADTRPRVLFHGDSITHGHGVFRPRETYVWRSCEIAGCVPLNLGFGGSAWTDTIVALFIASRNDWDTLVLALGNNSFGGADSAGKPETVAQYAKKYDAFLSTIREKAATKPILVVTPILAGADLGPRKNRNGEIPQDYRYAIQRVVKLRQAKDKNLHFLDGLQLVNDPIYLLPTDVVHPNVAGELRMADGIAASLKPILPKKGATNAAR
jgi:lysophospholipase L1-like esterase